MWVEIICHRIGKRSGLCLAQQWNLKFPTKREFFKVIKLVKKSVPWSSCRIRRNWYNQYNVHSYYLIYSTISAFAWRKCGKSLIIQRGDPLTGLTFEPEISWIQVWVISKKSFLGPLYPEDEGILIIWNITNNLTFNMA
jgi:hypothetical protein